ncbi:MAG: DUF2442 domain-containing protein [Anaerolineae bacterium]|jgi:hypothetical protein
MLKDVIDVRVMDDYQLHLRFEDGVQGAVDVADLVPFTGVFAPLRSQDYFRRVRVDAELGTIYWPNGADLDPDVLYSLVTGEPILLAEAEALLVA